MWELDCKEGWAPKNWCFWTVVLEKTLAGHLDCKEIQPVHPKGDQSWVFIGRTYTETETPMLWPPHVKSLLTGKYPDAGRDWGQEEKGTTEDEMAGWHHRLNAYESEWTLGVGDGQGGLACWFMGLQSQTRLNDWTELILLRTSRLNECRLNLTPNPLCQFFPNPDLWSRVAFTLRFSLPHHDMMLRSLVMRSLQLLKTPKDLTSAQQSACEFLLPSDAELPPNGVKDESFRDAGYF